MCRSRSHFNSPRDVCPDYLERQRRRPEILYSEQFGPHTKANSEDAERDTHGSPSPTRTQEKTLQDRLDAELDRYLKRREPKLSKAKKRYISARQAWLDHGIETRCRCEWDGDCLSMEEPVFTWRERQLFTVR